MALASTFIYKLKEHINCNFYQNQKGSYYYYQYRSVLNTTQLNIFLSHRYELNSLKVNKSEMYSNNEISKFANIIK